MLFPFVFFLQKFSENFFVFEFRFFVFVFSFSFIFSVCFLLFLFSNQFLFSKQFNSIEIYSQNKIKIMSTTPTPKRKGVSKLSGKIPTLSLAKTEQTKDPKKLQRASFSEEFKEKIVEKKITITVKFNNDVFDQEMDEGHTVRNLIKIIEAKYDLPKDQLELSYNDNFLLSCLSFSDIPDFVKDPHPTVIAMMSN